jgi:hypothetical protein
MNAEWTKLRTLRGPRWTLLAGLLAAIAFGALISYFMNRNFASVVSDGKPFEPVRTSFGGLVLGQLAMVVLGVTVIGGEYASGMIRLSLTAVPDRTVFYVAKAAVLAAVTLLVGLLTAFTAFFIGPSAPGPACSSPSCGQRPRCWAAGSCCGGTTPEPRAGCVPETESFPGSPFSTNRQMPAWGHPARG